MVRREHTDVDVLAALRTAAEQTGQPMSATAYDAAGGVPSSSRVVQRFGAWNTACAAAGLATRAASRPAGARWDAPAVRVVVSRFLGDGAGSSYAAYVTWAAGRADAPSGQTVRNVLGSWNDAKAAAREQDGQP